MNNDQGQMCVDNPVCATKGITDGACCPNDNGDYDDCCNRQCSLHPRCSHLAANCCPSIDNVQLACCDHQLAIDALTPSYSPSQVPTTQPSEEPSSIPSEQPSEESTTETLGSKEGSIYDFEEVSKIDLMVFD